MQSLYSPTKVFSEFRCSVHIAIPLIVTELIYGLSGFITTMFVARLGREELAANILVWPIFVALILFFIGILCSVSVLVAQSFGAKDHNGIQIAARQGILVAIIAAIPMMLAMLVATNILSLTGQDPAIIKLATPYFHSLVWCMLPFTLLIVFEQLLLGMAKTRLVMFMSILIVPVQIGCIYLFMFGKLGLPHCALASIGYGFACSYSFAALVVGLFIHFAKPCREYQIFSKFWQFNRRFFTEIFRLGLPIGSMYCLELGLFAAVSLMMGKFGANALAAHQIAMQCTTFGINIIFGLAQTIGIRIGHEVGRNNRDALKLAFFVNLGIGFLSMLILMILYLWFPKLIIALDLNIHDPKYQVLIQYAISFMAVAAFIQFSDCMRMHCVAALRSLKDTKFPMLVSIVGFWLIAFPMAYILGFWLHLHGFGVWCGVLIGLTCCAIALFMRFNYLVSRLDLQQLVTRMD